MADLPDLLHPRSMRWMGGGNLVTINVSLLLHLYLHHIVISSTTVSFCRFKSSTFKNKDALFLPSLFYCESLCNVIAHFLEENQNFMLNWTYKFNTFQKLSIVSEYVVQVKAPEYTFLILQKCGFPPKNVYNIDRTFFLFQLKSFFSVSHQILHLWKLSLT